MRAVGAPRNRTGETKTPIPLAPRWYTSGLGGLLAPSGQEAQMKAMGSVGTLFIVVSRLAETVSQVDWKLWRKPVTPDAEPIEVISHPALDLWTRPNHFFPQQEFVETFQQHHELVGEAYWVIAKAGTLPVEMWPVRPDRMEPVPHPTKFLAGYIYTSPDGERVPLRTDEVIQLRRPNPLDPYRGMGAVASVLTELYSSAAAAEWNRKFFTNSALPAGAIRIPEDWNDTEIEKFTKLWEGAHRGPGNAHKIALLMQGAEFQTIAFNMRDMQFTELRAVTEDMIRRAFGFPKPVLGDVDDVNRAVAEAMRVIYADWVQVPRLERIKGALNNELLPMYGPTAQDLYFDYVSPVPTDREAEDRERVSKATAYKTYLDAGVEPDDEAMLREAGLPKMKVTPKPAPPPPGLPAPGKTPGPPGKTPPPKPKGLAFGRTRRELAAAAADGEDPDLAGVLADLERALDRLEAAWRPVLGDQIDSLVDQIEQAIDDGDLAALAAIEVPEDLRGADTLQQALDDMAATAVRRAEAEVADLDVQVDAEQAEEDASAAAAVAALAAAGALLVAGALAAAAAGEALRLWSPGSPDPLPARRVAMAVRAYLETDPRQAGRRAAFGGDLHRVVNVARLVVQGLALTAVPELVIRATEVNDQRTCDPCEDIDGTEFRTVAAAWAAYGAGGYRYCEGGVRCRGTTRLVRRREDG